MAEIKMPVMGNLRSQMNDFEQEAYEKHHAELMQKWIGKYDAGDNKRTFTIDDIINPSKWFKLPKEK